MGIDRNVMELNLRFEISDAYFDGVLLCVEPEVEGDAVNQFKTFFLVTLFKS